jgi:hypothetical protein
MAGSAVIDDPRYTTPLYHKAEAAHIIAVPAQTFRDWAVGYAHKRLDGSLLVSAPIVTTLEPARPAKNRALSPSYSSSSSKIMLCIPGHHPVFPSPKGKYWRSSNFRRHILERAYLDAGWPDSSGEGRWTWHSLRHVFCTTALFTWKLEPADVSRMAGHATTFIVSRLTVTIRLSRSMM